MQKNQSMNWWYSWIVEPLQWCAAINALQVEMPRRDSRVKRKRSSLQVGNRLLAGRRRGPELTWRELANPAGREILLSSLFVRPVYNLYNYLLRRVFPWRRWSSPSRRPKKRVYSVNCKYYIFKYWLERKETAIWNCVNSICSICNKLYFINLHFFIWYLELYIFRGRNRYVLGRRSPMNLISAPLLLSPWMV